MCRPGSRITSPKQKAIVHWPAGAGRPRELERAGLVARVGGRQVAAREERVERELVLRAEEEVDLEQHAPVITTPGIAPPASRWSVTRPAMPGVMPFMMSPSRSM